MGKFFIYNRFLLLQGLFGWIAAGVAATVPAPIVIVGGLAAVGFTAPGIVAGSAAASMMSWGAGK